MAREPIYSVGQFPPGKDIEGAPIPFMFNATGPIGHLQSELHWRLFDFCRIHQIVYKEILSVEKKLDGLDEIQLTGDIESAEELQKVRILDAAMEKDNENRRVTIFVDHMTIVGLWAIAEQFLGKVYREFCSIQDEIDPDDISVPYRWDDFIREYSSRGICLADRENYENANECRAVNNSIKHAPKVGDKLLVFNYFIDYAGKELESVPVEMQRYLNGVSDFIGSLIEKANEVLSA